MVGYENVAAVLNFLVNLLLLLASGRFCGTPVRLKRALLSALVGGIYARACLAPEMYFLGNGFGRAAILGIMSVITFGVERSALRKGAVFVFLSFALSGAVLAVGKGGFWGFLAAAGMLCLVCWFGFWDREVGVSYVPVELQYNGKHLHLTALRDTGNTLRDPVTGQQVLVIGADAAQRLTGLTRTQLQCPVESLEAVPGLRLIPYHSIGISGFLLALRIPNVKIGSWKGSSLVAFAPDGLSMEGEYQALTGGTV